MNFKKTLPLLLAATLATAPAFAEDGFNFIGGSDAQVEKVAKAPREANGHSSNLNFKEAAIAFGLGGLGPLGAIGLPFVGVSAAKRVVVEMNSFYSGTVVRGKVEKIFPLGDSPTTAQFLADTKKSGIDASTIPAPETIRNNLVALRLDVDGPTDSERIVVARKDAGYEVGDILDAKTVDQKSLLIDYNKHMSRVVNVYCKHDNPVCQNDYESSLGVISRHTDTEFPPSQYLIAPKIIQADQERMRHETEEKTKTASTWGESSLF